MLLASRQGCSNVLLYFQRAELGQLDYDVFSQEGLRWRMRKDKDDLCLAKCSTLYSAV